MSSILSSKNSINELQEYAQKNHVALPTYEIKTNNQDSHTATVKFMDMTMQATSHSKKEAKRQVANQLIQKIYKNEKKNDIGHTLNSLNISLIESPSAANCKNGNQTDACQPPSASATNNPINKLQEYAQSKKFTLPTYIYLHEGQQKYTVRVEFLDYKTEASGESKQQAKHDAAHKMLAKLGITTNGSKESKKEEKYATYEEEFGSKIDSIGMLQAVCRENNKPLPTYDIKKIMKESKEMFEATCTVDGLNYSNYAPAREEAMRMAASQAFHITFLSGLKSTNNSKTEAVSDAHKYFFHFPDELKKAAFEVLAKSYDSNKAKAQDIMRALKLTYTIQGNYNDSAKDMYYILEIECDFSPVFTGTEQELWEFIVLYFNSMLR